MPRAGAAAWRSVPGRTRAATLADLSSLTPGGFARTVAEVLRDLGYHYLQLRAASGDPLAHVLGRDPRGRRVAVSCKGYGQGEKVTTAELRAFTDGLADHPTAEVGMVVTTSRFAAGARVHARRSGVQLVDGPHLVRLLASTSRLAPAPSPRRRLEWTG